MKYILEFTDYEKYLNKESRTRTKELDEEEFIQIFKENCTQFSFKNDQLWRGKGDTGEFGLFLGQERSGTIGKYKYQSIMKDDLPVVRKNSLIGSTSREMAKHLTSDGAWGSSPAYLVIPFDNSKIVFCKYFDIAVGERSGKEISLDDFELVTYKKGFKCPYKGQVMPRGNVGNEFFTDSYCLLVREDKVKWLESILGNS